MQTFLRTWLKWFTRLPILILFLLVFNPFGLDFAEAISQDLGLAKPSLITLIGVALLFIILERIIIVEDEVTKGVPLRTYETRNHAYTELSERGSSQKVQKIDLLQFSGDTARELLRNLANHSPKAKVRMLLFDPNLAGQFDSDDEDHHAQRIRWMANWLRVLEEDLQNHDFVVNIRYYEAMPSVSAVIIDDNIVSVSWYRCYFDEGVMRLRGHSSATITGSGEPAAPLLTFAQNQFNELWKTSKEASRVL